MRKVKRTVRAEAEYLGESRVRFTFPCGHFRTETLMVPARGGGKQPMSPAMVRKLAAYWGPGQQVAVSECLTCAKKRRER